MWTVFSHVGGSAGQRRAQKGPASAATATAHKLTRLYYSLVKQGGEYAEQSAADDEARERERALVVLRQRAQRYGYELMAPAARKTKRQRRGRGLGRRRFPSAGTVS